MKIEISEESFAFVKSLLEEIDGQSNRMTASPYFYVLQENRTEPAVSGAADFMEYYDSGREFCGNVAAFIDEYADPDEGFEKPDGWDGASEADKVESLLEQFPDVDENPAHKVWREPEDHNVFFTEAAINKYIAQNRYHWGEVRTYVRHAWRNPEMAGIFSALRDIAKATP